MEKKLVIPPKDEDIPEHVRSAYRRAADIRYVEGEKEEEELGD